MNWPSNCYMDPCWAVESNEEFKSFWTGVTGAIQQLLCSISTGVLLINTSAKLMIVTGSVDSICRLWAVGFIMDKDSDSKDKIWRVRLLNKIEGHSSAIMDILHHPNDALVSTLDDSLAQFSQMDGEEKEKKIALSQSALDIAEAIASKVHHEDLVVALNTPNRYRAEEPFSFQIRVRVPTI